MSLTSSPHSLPLGGEVIPPPIPSGPASVGSSQAGSAPQKKQRKQYTITRPRESWTSEEHDLFVEGLGLYERDWKRIADHIKTKSVIQIRSHAQKHFLKMQKMGMKECIPAPRLQKKPESSTPKRKRERREKKAKTGANGESSGSESGSSGSGSSDSESDSSESASSRSGSASSNSSLSRASRSRSASLSRSRSSSTDSKGSRGSKERKSKKRKHAKVEKIEKTPKSKKRTPASSPNAPESALAPATTPLPGRAMPSPLSGVKSKSKKVGLYPMSRIPATESLFGSDSLLGVSASKLFKREAVSRLKQEGIDLPPSSNVSEAGQPAGSWAPPFNSNSSVNWNMDAQSHGEADGSQQLPIPAHSHAPWSGSSVGPNPLRVTANASVMPNYATLNQLSPLSQLSQATDVVDNELSLPLPPALHETNSVTGNESLNDYLNPLRNSARRSRHSGGSRLKSTFLHDIPLSRVSSANNSTILNLAQTTNPNAAASSSSIAPPLPLSLSNAILHPRGPSSIGDRDRAHAGSPLVPHSSSSQAAAEGDNKEKGGDKPEFSKVYAFLGSLFDPSRKNHAEKEFDKLTPMNRDILQGLMQNLATNLKTKSGDNMSARDSDAVSEGGHAPAPAVGLFTATPYSGRISGNNSVASPVSSRKSVAALDPPTISSGVGEAIPSSSASTSFPLPLRFAGSSAASGLFSSILGSNSAHHSPVPINTTSFSGGIGLFSSTSSAPRSPTGSIRDGLPFSGLNTTPAVDRSLSALHTPGSGAGIYSPFQNEFMTPQSGANAILSGSRLVSSLATAPLPVMQSLNNFSPALNSVASNNNPPSLPPI